MATTAPYTPPSMTKARSHLAVTIQHNHGTKAVNDARADIATCLLYTSPSPRDS